MVKQLQKRNAWNFLNDPQLPLLLLLLLIFISSNVNGEDIWKLPTAKDLETSLENCHTTSQSMLHSYDDDYSNIRCIALALKLWTDEEGFNAKRFIKLLNKHQQPAEILIVIDYCNNRHKQIDFDKWAEEAYQCFARGRIGIWLSEYISNVYKKKTTLKI